MVEVLTPPTADVLELAAGYGTIVSVTTAPVESGTPVDMGMTTLLLLLEAGSTEAGLTAAGAVPAGAVPDGTAGTGVETRLAAREGAGTPLGSGVATLDEFPNRRAWALWKRS